MKTLLARIASVGVAAGLATAMTPQAAQAAPNSNTCTNVRLCVVTATNFPGGTVSVDVGVWGTSGAWILGDSDSARQCAVNSFPGRSIQSWTCRGVRAGTLKLTATGEPTINVGIRW